MELASGSHVILGVEYRDAVAFVRTRPLDSEVSELVPMVGLELQFEVDDTDRVCLGHRSLDLPGQPYVDCQKPLDEPGQAKCRRCRAVDARLAANLHHAHRLPRGQVDKAVSGHLDQVNYLYLAGFRDGSIKIGTSSGRRRTTRWAEQGAWLADVVARADDGIAVRVAEDLVTAELGIAQSVSVGRKLAGLAAPRPDAELRAELDVLADRVAMLVAELPGVHPEREQYQFEGINRPVWNTVMQYPLSLDRGVHQFAIVDACGRLAAIQRPRAAPDVSPPSPVSGTAPSVRGSRSPVSGTASSVRDSPSPVSGTASSDASSSGRTPAEAVDHFVVNLGKLYGRPFHVGNHTPDDILVQDSLF